MISKKSNTQVGYQSERTLRDSCKHIMDGIEAITNGDLKKQYEVAKSIIGRVAISVEVARL